MDILKALRKSDPIFDMAIRQNEFLDRMAARIGSLGVIGFCALVDWLWQGNGLSVWAAVAVLAIGAALDFVGGFRAYVRLQALLDAAAAARAADRAVDGGSISSMTVNSKPKPGMWV